MELVVEVVWWGWDTIKGTDSMAETHAQEQGGIHTLYEEREEEEEREHRGRQKVHWD